MYFQFGLIFKKMNELFYSLNNSNWPPLNKLKSNFLFLSFVWLYSLYFSLNLGYSSDFQRRPQIFFSIFLVVFIQNPFCEAWKSSNLNILLNLFEGFIFLVTVVIRLIRTKLESEDHKLKFDFLDFLEQWSKFWSFMV